MPKKKSEHYVNNKDFFEAIVEYKRKLRAAAEKEFPEIIKIQSIGKSWEKRDILALTLDARQVLRAQGIVPISVDKPVLV